MDDWSTSEIGVSISITKVKVHFKDVGFNRWNLKNVLCMLIITWKLRQIT